MKRYLSVFEMITRSSIYKVLAILIAMVAAEMIACAIAWQQPLALLKPNIEEWVDQSYFVIAFGVAYILMTVVLVLSGTNIGSVQSYTLQRLRIPEKKVYLLQCIYNILCYILLWGTQLAVLLGISTFYMNYKTHVVKSNQTVFLAFHRNEFMHSILPMEDFIGWFLLITLIAGTGIFAASFTRKQRQGKVEWSLIVFVAIACIAFPRELGEEPALFGVVCIIYMVTIIINVLLGKGVEKDENKR